MSDADLPHNEPAEKGILGAVLFDNANWTRAAERLGAGDFYFEAHQKLWAVISDMVMAGRVADGITLGEHFEREGDLQAIGGSRYLTNLLDSAAFGPEVNDYAEVVRELAIRRRLIEAGQNLIEAARKPVERRTRQSGPMLLAAAVEQLNDVSITVSPERWKDSRHATIDAMTQLAKNEHVPGIETGIEKLDRFTGGFRRGDLVVLGARPSMGKSAIADQIETNVALRLSPDPDRGAPGPMNAQKAKRMVVAKFSLEMGEEQLAYRNAARMAHQTQGHQVAYSDLAKNMIGQADFKAIRAAMPELPMIHWDTTPVVDLGHMRTGLRRLMQRYGRIDLISCDYIQIMDQRRERGQSMADAVGNLTKGLKVLAREFNAPLLALSQLSREVEKREDKRPLMSDLRDSGSIEADADTVIMAHRRHYYLSREPEPKDAVKREQRDVELADCEPKITLIIGKQRMGPIGDVDVYWDARTSHIVSARDDLHKDLGRMFG